MVVVVIIGMLAGAVALKVSGYMDAAKVNRAKSDIATVVDAVEAYYLASGRYPTNDEGLTNLMLKNRQDPWGNPYEYNCPGKTEPFEVFSLGADGRPGGDDINADIYSWQIGEVSKDGKK
jgi:general secretion pathway protein G